MIVYSIYNGGMPYYTVCYRSLEECKQALYSILDYNKKHRKLFFVDNDFYKNETAYFPEQSIYYCIHKREVSEWSKLETKLQNRKKEERKNNIIDFKNCSDTIDVKQKNIEKK